MDNKPANTRTEISSSSACDINPAVKGNEEKEEKEDVLDIYNPKEKPGGRKTIAPTRPSCVKNTIQSCADPAHTFMAAGRFMREARFIFHSSLFRAIPGTQPRVRRKETENQPAQFPAQAGDS